MVRRDETKAGNESRKANPLLELALEEASAVLDHLELDKDDMRLLHEHIPRRLYSLLGDQTLDWCLERFIAARTESEFQKYRSIFEDFGYDVDGYPESFMEKLPAIIADTNIPVRVRGVLAIGAVCHPVLCREHAALDNMELICLFCMGEVLDLPLSSGTVSPIVCLRPTDCVPIEIDAALIRWFSTPDNLYYTPVRGLRRLFFRKKVFDHQRFFGRILQSLLKRRAAFSEYIEGNLILPDAFLEKLVTEGSKCANRLNQLGFHRNNIDALRRGLISLWGLDTPLYCEKLADCVVFKTRFLAIDPNVNDSWCLRVVWHVIEEGRIVIERVALSNQTPAEPDSWCVNTEA